MVTQMMIGYESARKKQKMIDSLKDRSQVEVMKRRW